jgi:DNA-binding winged helix-turn-helix (wHTH) protein
MQRPTRVARMTQAEQPSHKEFSFASFRLLRDKRLLLRGEDPVRLGGRALEILAALVERPGTVVTKEELFARVWPKQFVEEGNLKFHVAALRKALGDGQGDNRFIVNIPGRGYCFVAAVESLDRKQPSAGAAVSNPESRLPTPITRIVGRSDTIVALATQLPQHRFITIVGPGGIGKTTVAVAVADTLLSTFSDGVRFIDLAPIGDSSHVPSAFAAALGASVQAENAVQGLISFLRDKHILIVVDNCEHVIEIVAALVEGIARQTRRTNILATSREPLRADGEHVHRLEPLAVPPVSEELTAAQALAFPAVQLFVERAVAAQDTFDRPSGSGINPRGSTPWSCALSRIRSTPGSTYSP